MLHLSYMLSFLPDIKDKMDIKWVESMGGIISNSHFKVS
ncbi:hypothetical protein C789_1817 [Microcystis aeruginosa FACHB-905 = DIANCHI905]|nr:hypothetical protein C789_1817 [Microcystis aeruginosa FACHB-905 = DIANCHI905]